MGNNLKIMGNTFSNVSSITAHDATNGIHKYVDTSDTTAVAGDIKKNKTFYGTDGVKIQGTLEVYAGAHHAVSSGYSVEISLTMGTSTSYFLSCNIYEFANGSLGEQIGTITSASGSTTVTVTSGGVAVDLHSNNSYMQLGSEQVTGGVSHDWNGYIDEGWNSHCRCTFFVTGNGTIEIQGIDWED